MLISGIEPSFHRHVAALRLVTAPAELPRYDSSDVAAVLRRSVAGGVRWLRENRFTNAHRRALFFASPQRNSLREILKKMDEFFNLLLKKNSFI